MPGLLDAVSDVHNIELAPGLTLEELGVDAHNEKENDLDPLLGCGDSLAGVHLDWELTP